MARCSFERSHLRTGTMGSWRLVSRSSILYLLVGSCRSRLPFARELSPLKYTLLNGGHLGISKLTVLQSGSTLVSSSPKRDHHVLPNGQRQSFITGSRRSATNPAVFATPLPVHSAGGCGTPKHFMISSRGEVNQAAFFPSISYHHGHFGCDAWCSQERNYTAIECLSGH